MVVSLAFLYNFWVIIYRFAFQEINGQWLRSACSLDVTKYTLVGPVFVPIPHFDELLLLSWPCVLGISTAKSYHFIILK